MNLKKINRWPIQKKLILVGLTFVSVSFITGVIGSISSVKRNTSPSLPPGPNIPDQTPQYVDTFDLKKTRFDVKKYFNSSLTPDNIDESKSKIDKKWILDNKSILFFQDSKIKDISNIETINVERPANAWELKVTLKFTFEQRTFEFYIDNFSHPPLELKKTLFAKTELGFNVFAENKDALASDWRKIIFEHKNKIFKNPNLLVNANQIKGWSIGVNTLEEIFIEFSIGSVPFRIEVDGFTIVKQKDYVATGYWPNTSLGMPKTENSFLRKLQLTDNKGRYAIYSPKINNSNYSTIDYAKELLSAMQSANLIGKWIESGSNTWWLATHRIGNQSTTQDEAFRSVFGKTLTEINEETNDTRAGNINSHLQLKWDKYTSNKAVIQEINGKKVTVYKSKLLALTYSVTDPKTSDTGWIDEDSVKDLEILVVNQELPNSRHYKAGDIIDLQTGRVVNPEDI